MKKRITNEARKQFGTTPKILRKRPSVIRAGSKERCGIMVIELRRIQDSFSNRQLAHLRSLESCAFGSSDMLTVWRTALAQMYLKNLPDGKNIKYAKQWAIGPSL